MSNYWNVVRQSYFAGKATFKEKDLPDLKDRVIVVTGANSGVGQEISRLAYSKNAKVYMMARSEAKNLKACEDIKAAFPQSTGELVCLPLDLADLAGIKASAAEIIRREDKVHVLFNNAGVGFSKQGLKTKQGYELQLGTNCLGHFAFTRELTPTLVSTAQVSPANTVRVVWASSTAAQSTPTKNFMERVKTIDKRSTFEQYTLSKLGNYFQATEFGVRYKASGIVSVPLNPGNLDTELWRTQGSIVSWLLRKLVLYPSVYGGYTNIFAGFSPKVTLDKSGTWIAPWGKLWNVSHDMVAGSKSSAEGGTGFARDFWEWNEAQIESHTKI